MAASGDTISAPLAPVGGLGRQRHAAGVAILLGGLPALTAILVGIREHLSHATPVLLVLTLVVAVALVGGLRVAVPSAVLGVLVLNWFFTAPYGTFHVDQPDQFLVLGVYLVVAIAVSTVVDLAARRSAEAARARIEAAALASMAGAAIAEHQTLPDLLERVRQVFGMREVVLLEAGADGWSPAAAAMVEEAPVEGEAELRVPAGPKLSLVARGPALFAEDQRVLRRFAEAAATALEGRRLAEQAEQAARLEAADRMRTALLAAVGHDLRTPLAGVKAAVSGLRQDDVEYSDDQRDELLRTIEEGADRLQGLVENLLDASRLQVGAVSVLLQPVGLDEVVGRALLALGEPERQRLRVDLPEGLPDACADPGLSERVIANVLDNALRHAPAGTTVTVRGYSQDSSVVCEVIDHGPGVLPQDWERLFAPFQRLGDRSVGGTGLGLSVAKGFAQAMNARLDPVATPAGGLTMRLTLPLANDVGCRADP